MSSVWETLVFLSWFPVVVYVVKEIGKLQPQRNDCAREWSVGRKGNTQCVIQHASRLASLQFGLRSNERDLMDL